MPSITRRPTSTVQQGGWTLTGGATVHAILADDSDSSYISTTARSQLPSQFAVFDIADLTTADVPAGAKIKSVTLKIKVKQVAPSGGSSFLADVIRFYGEVVEEVIHADIFGILSNFFRLFFSFPCPVPPSGGTPVFQTVTVRTWQEKPSGGEWTLGTINAQTWKLGRSDVTGQNSQVAEAYILVDYNERPVVTISGPASPVTGTTRPIVTASYSDAEGDPQDAIRFRVFTQAQTVASGFDVESTVPYAASPGTDNWIAGQTNQWLLNTDLPNGDYVVYAQARQQWQGVGTHLSTWDAWTFTVNVPGPPAPVLTVTPNDVGAWNQIDIVAGGASPPTETYTILSSDNGGVSWDHVWGGWQLAADASGVVSLIDYMPPLNQARWYKALAYTTIGSIKVASVESAWVAATVRQLEFQFTAPFTPSLNMAAGVMGDSPSVQRSQGAFPVLTAEGDVAYKVVINGTPRGIEGELDLLFLDRDSSLWDRFRALWAAGHTILWRWPNGRSVWVKFGGRIEWKWRTDGATGVDFRVPTLPYIEVAPPVDPALPS